jgi:hypothetical protein
MGIALHEAFFRLRAAEQCSVRFLSVGWCDAVRLRKDKRISEEFLTRLRVAATLVSYVEQRVVARNGGKEVKLQYRFTNDSNWPLGTRVDICA